jgi:hypothetical protein
LSSRFAASYVRRLGPKALDDLEEKAELAEALGDTESARSGARSP